MKRLVSIILIAIIILTMGLVGCKKKDKKEEVKEDNTKCSYCGAKIVEGTLYCVWCGESHEKGEEK